ncbi:MAG: outer membrane beta-barrel protein [Aeoliella sp.]
MNIVRWTMGCALIAISAQVALADEAVRTAFNYDLVGYQCGEPACNVADPGCACDDACCTDNCCSDSCCSGCCGNSCGSSCCCDRGSCLDGLCGDCCLGCPCRLKDHVSPCCWLDFGGWTQLGYHDDNTRQSQQFNDLRAFNDVPDQLNLHQQYFWFEKKACAPCCGMDWGFRFDMLYGTDAQKTQAFGNDNAQNRNQGKWDASLDHGEYGWAFPQLYGEVAFGDWSVIAGHFYTIVGYEVVPAPDNFFYSHSYTMFNSEPFTHTGALGTYSGVDNMDIYVGWVMGWDTGFDQSFGGNQFLGGVSTQLTNSTTFSYILTAGTFGQRSLGADGYSHSIVFDTAVSCNLNYVFQSDLVSYNDFGLGGGSQVGINQYLFYTVNDCVSLGTRFEWWKSDGVVAANDSASSYAWTYGLNYKPHANIVIRPEVRHNWLPAENAFIANNGTDFNQTVFGIDAIFTY